MVEIYLAIGIFKSSGKFWFARWQMDTYLMNLESCAGKASKDIKFLYHTYNI